MIERSPQYGGKFVSISRACYPIDASSLLFEIVGNNPRSRTNDNLTNSFAQSEKRTSNRSGTRDHNKILSSGRNRRVKEREKERKRKIERSKGKEKRTEKITGQGGRVFVFINPREHFCGKGEAEVGAFHSARLRVIFTRFDANPVLCAIETQNNLRARTLAIPVFAVKYIRPNGDQIAPSDATFPEFYIHASTSDGWIARRISMQMRRISRPNWVLIIYRERRFGRYEFRKNGHRSPVFIIPASVAFIVCTLH